jgi:entry exclusion lipoprotein TrbK
MLTVTRCVSITVALAIFSAVGGCGEKAEIPCQELEKRSDVYAKAELEKRCPRRGGPFKPSPVRNW